MIASIDWAHTKPLNFNLDGKSHEVEFKDITTFIKNNCIDIVVGENIPSKILLVLLEHKIKVFRCNGKLTAEYRKQNGYKKESDELDAIYILEMYNKYPDLFYEYTEDDKKFLRAKHLYKLRESIQKSRIQYSLKISAYKNFYMFDNDIIDKLSSIHKELLQKENYLDRKFETIYFKKYIEIFNDIVGLGGVTIAHIVSEIGDINRFSNEQAFLNYAFGYTKLNYNHRLKTRLLMAVDSVIIHHNKFYTEFYHFYKECLKKKHPEKIVENGKTKYNPLHLTRLTKRRVAREIAKLIYKRLKKYSGVNNGIPLITNKNTRTICLMNATDI